MPGSRPVAPAVQGMAAGANKDPAEADRVRSRLTPDPELFNGQPVRLGNRQAAAPRTFILRTADKDSRATARTGACAPTARRVRLDPNLRGLEPGATHVVNPNDPRAAAEARLSLL